MAATPVTTSIASQSSIGGPDCHSAIVHFALSGSKPAILVSTSIASQNSTGSLGFHSAAALLFWSSFGPLMSFTACEEMLSAMLSSSVTFSFAHAIMRASSLAADALS